MPTVKTKILEFLESLKEIKKSHSTRFQKFFNSKIVKRVHGVVKTLLIGGVVGIGIGFSINSGRIPFVIGPTNSVEFRKAEYLYENWKNLWHTRFEDNVWKSSFLYEPTKSVEFRKEEYSTAKSETLFSYIQEQFFGKRKPNKVEIQPSPGFLPESKNRFFSKLIRFQRSIDVFEMSYDYDSITMKMYGLLRGGEYHKAITHRNYLLEYIVKNGTKELEYIFRLILKNIVLGNLLTKVVDTIDRQIDIILLILQRIWQILASFLIK